jgi:ABC-2 type transport system permease protein
MTGLILVGLLPFAALGVLLGHLLTPDTIGPAAGGLVSLLALVSGTWFPLDVRAGDPRTRRRPPRHRARLT